jgi:hypothetical protein
VLRAFDTEYPGIARVAARVSRLREIVTPLGRRLLLDRDRTYIGINNYIHPPPATSSPRPCSA